MGCFGSKKKYDNTDGSSSESSTQHKKGKDKQPKKSGPETESFSEINQQAGGSVQSETTLHNVEVKQQNETPKQNDQDRKPSPTGRISLQGKNAEQTKSGANTKQIDTHTNGETSTPQSNVHTSGKSKAGNRETGNERRDKGGKQSANSSSRSGGKHVQDGNGKDDNMKSTQKESKERKVSPESKQGNKNAVANTVNDVSKTSSQGVESGKGENSRNKTNHAKTNEHNARPTSVHGNSTEVGKRSGQNGQNGKEINKPNKLGSEEANKTEDKPSTSQTIPSTHAGVAKEENVDQTSENRPNTSSNNQESDERKAVDRSTRSRSNANDGKDKEIKELKEEIEKLNSIIDEKEQEIKETTERADKQMKAKSSKKKTNEASLKENKIKKLELECNNMRGTIENLNAEKDKETKEFTDLRKKYEQKIRELEKEKDDLLLRLSALAGNRLTDNNPDIADLSDMNRPTKLAEKYSELYDNQWTDAFQYLEDLEKFKHLDTKIINMLLNILVVAYELALKTAEAQLVHIRHILDDTFKGMVNTVDLVKQFKDQRKKTLSPDEKLKKEFHDEVKKMFSGIVSSELETDHMKNYMVACLELCWLMTIQDPPVYLQCEVCKKGDKFDKNLYREYTQSGSFVAFTVWPALFLHKGDALLSKGVVQCQKRPSSFRKEKKPIIQGAGMSKSFTGGSQCTIASTRELTTMSLPQPLPSPQSSQSQKEAVWHQDISSTIL